MAIRDYQYETSPRKLEPEYEPRKKKKVTHTKKKATTKSKKQSQREKIREERKNKFLISLNCIFILLALFAIIWRNSLISQSFSQIQVLKSNISELQKKMIN